jgi:hypothetical protein
LLLVLAAIEFDDQFRLRAYEIGNETRDRHLSPEAESFESATAQVFP